MTPRQSKKQSPLSTAESEQPSVLYPLQKIRQKILLGPDGDYTPVFGVKSNEIGCVSVRKKRKKKPVRNIPAEAGVSLLNTAVFLPDSDVG
jgi:hypothetical protein